MTNGSQKQVASTDSAPVVALRGIGKRFAGVQALSEGNLELQRGEVHALVGENGAGKSTLMNVLAGIHTPDAGTVEVDGQQVAFSGPAAARRHGIEIVHQETSLFDHMSVAENVLAGRVPRGRLGTVADRSMRRLARECLAELGVRIAVESRLSELGVGQRQLVEIARALGTGARVVIFDEPTAALSTGEAEILFGVIARLRSAGTAVVYISHRLEEVFRIADRVTVMRDGRWVATRTVTELDSEQAIQLMVGRSLGDLYGQPAHQLGDPVLHVANLTLPGVFSDVSFTVRAGEIVGLAGLVGAGRTDIGLALFGATPKLGGTVQLAGRVFRPRSPSHALQRGLAYVTEDRRVGGLFADLSVADNIAVTHLRQASRAGLIRNAQLRRLAKTMIETLTVRTPSLNQPVRLLSGGNQQKVLLAKWVSNPLRVLIVDEPTKGVDVGAKADIYRLLRRLAAEGLAIIMISSEMTELVGMSDRIIVVHQGRLAGELPREAFEEELILRLASGYPSQERAS